MKQCFDSQVVAEMRQAIVDRYGPTIHGDFVKDMSVDRIARIYVNMKQLEERRYVPNECIKGQISLFD